MANAHIEKPIAATINPKPILYFIGEPSSNSQRKPYAILASEICDGHHKKSLLPSDRTALLPAVAEK
jgi:hypothetical protein